MERMSYKSNLDINNLTWKNSLNRIVLTNGSINILIITY